MKLRLIALLLLIPALLCAQKANRGFVKQVVAKYKAAASISYTVDYKIKYYSQDTVHLKRDFRFVRNEKDTLFGGYFWSYIEDREQGDYYEYYNNGSAYSIDPGQKTIFKYDMEEDSYNFFVGCRSENYVNSMFMKPETILETIDDRESKVVYKDTIINKLSFAVTEILLPDPEPSICCSTMTLALYFNKKTVSVEKVIFIIETLGDTNYQEWVLNDIIMNKETSASLHDEYKKLPKNYIVADYVPHTSSTGKPLEMNIPAPVFTAKTYPDFREVSLTDYKGKIVLLHFWYMSETWYSKAMHALNIMQQKYPDDVVVLGVNPYDDDPESLAKMPDFINKHNIVYTLLFSGRDVLKPYNLFLGPELYIIDQDGVIRHFEWIVIEKLEADLDEAIQKLLEN